MGGCGPDSLYNRAPVSNSILYFAYTALLHPDRIGEVAPGAKFRFTAHYPETRLGFVVSDAQPATPTLVRDPEHTVWGAVFEIPADQVDSLKAAERAEGRRPGFAHRAVDREGNKYDCLTFVASGEETDKRPDADYIEAMIKGARHWSLPAGWVMGLEDLAEDPLFS